MQWSSQRITRKNLKRLIPFFLIPFLCYSTCLQVWDTFSSFDLLSSILSDKILINIGEVFWCCIILVYLEVCHDLQYQRLLEGPGICSLFFINFNSFNYIRIKIYNGMLCRFPFLEVELFFMQNFMFINEFNKPGVH